MTGDTLPKPVREASTMITLVFRELQHADGPLTVAELERRTGLSTRGIRAATTDLEEMDLVRHHYQTDRPQCKVFEIRG